MNSKDVSISTLCALAAAAFVVACVAHEAIGHGGACLATGGTIKLLTSVYFRCAPSRPVIDAAGPLTNLVVAAIVAGLLLKTVKSNLLRPFLALVRAFNGFWGAGYLIFSAITNTGDWAFVLRDLQLQPLWLWRTAMAPLGAFLYVVSLRLVAGHLARGTPLFAAYTVAGIVACSSTFFYPGAILPAIQEAAKESLLAAVGLVLLAFRRSQSHLPAGAVTVPFSFPILALSAFIVVLFWLILGRGISDA